MAARRIASKTSSIRPSIFGNGGAMQGEPAAPPDCADAADAAQRASRIAEAAYFRAESRGFAPGFELEDWLLAEREIQGDTDPGSAELLRSSEMLGR